MVEIEHRGMKVTFDEDTDTWRCSDLDFSDAKLSTLKSKIDGVMRKDRRMNVPALMLSRSYREDDAKVESVMVTILCGARESRYGGRDEGVVECWVNGRDGRKKVRIDGLIPPAEEAAARVWVDLDKAARVATDKAREANAAIPRFNADMLALAAKEKAATE